MDFKDNKEAILAVYKETFEDLRERRRIEWQTFAIVNLIYLGLLKTLQGICSLSVGQAFAATLVIAIFTYVWFIRIYGNAMRFKFLQNIRGNIQEIWKCEEIIENSKTGRGWKKLGLDDDWIFYGHRGICVTIALYGLISVFVLWMKVENNIWIESRDFISSGILLTFIFIIAAVYLDLSHCCNMKKKMKKIASLASAEKI